MECESDQEALRQLLAKRAGYGDSPGVLTSLVLERLSLPRGQGKPVELASVLPAVESERVKEFERDMLLSPEERAAVLERGLEGECHLDPVLEHDTVLYHRFISELFSCNLIHFTENPRVQIGAFVVTKKNGKQRLIVDARRANRLFRRPPCTLLGSAETWGRLEADSDQTVFVAQEDVKDYFYRLGISKELGEFFSLPEIDPHLFKQVHGSLPAELAKVIDQHACPIYPCMAVLPMGFSWAFHLAHQAHVHIASSAIPHAGIIKDRTPQLSSDISGSSTALLIYADNNNHVGVSKAQVRRDQDAVMKALHARGLDMQDVTEAASLSESLGVRIDGLDGKVQPTPKRDWRLDRALSACCRGVRLSGQELQVIIGHIAVRSLLHRGFLGVTRYAKGRAKLWGSVMQELYLFRHLMPFGVGSFKQRWASTQYCTDADLSRRLGRHDERWRFRVGDARTVAPRLQALSTDGVFSDPRTVKPDIDGEVEGPIEQDLSFPNVEKECMDSNRWRRLWRTPVCHREPVHVIEACSILGAVKHIVRDSRFHHQRFVILNDNMSVVLAMQKGRCGSFSLLLLVRRVSAHSLASGCRFYVRWVPSEWNVADKDSKPPAQA